MSSAITTRTGSHPPRPVRRVSSSRSACRRGPRPGPRHARAGRRAASAGVAATRMRAGCVAAAEARPARRCPGPGSHSRCRRRPRRTRCRRLSAGRGREPALDHERHVRCGRRARGGRRPGRPRCRLTGNSPRAIVRRSCRAAVISPGPRCLVGAGRRAVSCRLSAISPCWAPSWRSRSSRLTLGVRAVDDAAPGGHGVQASRPAAGPVRRRTPARARTTRPRRRRVVWVQAGVVPELGVRRTVPGQPQDGAARRARRRAGRPRRCACRRAGGR